MVQTTVVLRHVFVRAAAVGPPGYSGGGERKTDASVESEHSALSCSKTSKHLAVRQHILYEVKDRGRLRDQGVRDKIRLLEHQEAVNRLVLVENVVRIGIDDLFEGPSPQAYANTVLDALCQTDT
ncbi:uncharacterized protein EMH_0086590 [Eimeria mitis]|uniref:Uncharacterized protein n=1 Tax=Eimeria mitis TaxID=44415 RepID=U6KEW0_9EIME|nr:uncharacterized protein EMH_0086590 [Eimeria mitis]CDJ36469.1 hypothetical protein EMH_0086590 [Eimeria mitis]